MDSILCLDLGTKMGWAMRKPDGQILHGHKDFTPRRHDSSGARFKMFRDFLRCGSIWAIDRVFFEAVEAHRGVAAAQIYGGFCSILMVERSSAYSGRTAQTHYQGVAVGTIKKAVTGRGNASKQDVMNAVVQLFTLDEKQAQALTYDEADALALLHYAISTETQ